MGEQLYGYTADEHEYHVDVPEQYISGDERVTIHLSAHGGGTVGEEYAGNGWDYLVTAGGRTVLEGSDIRSAEGRAAGHAEMARTLAGFLSAAGESFHSHEHYQRDGWQASEYAGAYTAEEAEWLAANYERLSMFDLDSEAAGG